MGLGATAQVAVADRLMFQSGRGGAVVAALLAALLAAWAFLPRRYPVLELQRLRQGSLTAPEAATRLHLLDTQIVMVSEAVELVKRKGRRIRLSVGFLAVAAGLAVAGTLMAAGGHHG